MLPNIEYTGLAFPSCLKDFILLKGKERIVFFLFSKIRPWKRHMIIYMRLRKSPANPILPPFFTQVHMTITLYRKILTTFIVVYISPYLQCEGKCAGRCKNTALLTCPTVPFKDIELPDKTLVNTTGIFDENLPAIVISHKKILSFFYENTCWKNLRDTAPSARRIL